MLTQEMAEVAKHDYAHELIAALERENADSVDLSLRHARVRLTHRGPAAQGQAILAEASAEYDGRRIRAQVAAASVAEATAVLGSVLRHRMSRLARRWEAGLDEQFAAAPQAWRHHAEQAHRPRHLPRPAQERKVLRHKSFELELGTADEAVEDMELMGYPFQMFKDLASGRDSVVYRDGPLTVSPRAPARMSLAEASERLNLTGWPFVFHAEPLTGRGRVMYRRYDGHYGLITPADA